MPHALIVDNDVENSQTLSQVFRECGYLPETAESLPQAREALLRHTPEIAILNEQLAGDDTLGLLESINLTPVTEIYLMSDQPNPRITPRAIRIGASDFFRKPVNKDRLARNLRDLSTELSSTAPAASTPSPRGDVLVGESKAMQRLYRLLRKCAPGDASIFLAGESGSGKELVARTIHQLSDRAGNDFVSLNCSALSPGLLESELFGHKKGSFTGATRDHRGYFQRASGGTLFLDEITEMNAGLQAKLLRVLESNEIRPVGGEQDIAVDARIITATNIDPEEAVGRGRLREDLYYRLAQFPIRVPALRERDDDVLLLADHFLKEQNATTGQNKTFSSRARKALQAYDWPGNVLELKTAVLHSHLLAGSEIKMEDLPGRVSFSNPGDGDFIRLYVGTPLAEIERRTILSTLEHYDGDKKKTAEVLGVSLKTLYNRLKQYKSA
ncbi:MAG TPA: sigma-54 dependent transcriptional regulator [Woeseiaceae bacterium]|nr:sigma-54 dependent transcriptional regulator [Woeseiaceae bacterium]